VTNLLIKWYLFLWLAVFSMETGVRAHPRGGMIPEGASYYPSWRLAVEANNVHAWCTVPSQCLMNIEAYMSGGQYDRDLNLIVEQALSYINEIDPSNDGMDAWILDVDDTCISNLLYYREKRYGYVCMVLYILNLSIGIYTLINQWCLCPVL